MMLRRLLSRLWPWPAPTCGTCDEWHYVRTIQGERFGDCTLVCHSCGYLPETWHCADYSRAPHVSTCPQKGDR